MKRLLVLVVLVTGLCACPGPGVVPLPEPDDGGQPALADAGTTPRLVKVLYAMQTEPDERAAYEAIRAAAGQPVTVELSTGLYVFGERGHGLVQPFSAPARLTERAFATTTVDGGTVFAAELGAVADVVVADFASLPAADQERVEYRVFHLVDAERQLSSCLQRHQQGEASLQWCGNDIIRASRRLRSIVELWSAGRVTVQPVAIRGGAGLTEPARRLLLMVAREGGTSLEQATVGELPATMARLTARVAE